TEDHIANMEKFFSSIDRNDLNLCWEPRGTWDPAVVREICARLRLGHAIDPFINKTETPDNCYFRLHGRNGWRYQYEPAELEELAGSLLRREAYVFFNNRWMTGDALKFCRILSDREA